MLRTPQFDEATHAYKTPDGRPLVSVTQALSGVGIIDTRWFDEQSAWKGSVVHKCCELWNKGTLNESTIDPGALGYLDSWREWCQRMKFKPVGVETPLYHPLAMYAGTGDAWDDHIDVDYKTGDDAPWHELQLPLYSNFHPNARARRRFVVRLRPNGKPYTREVTENFSYNLGVGISAVNVAHWKRAH